MYWPIFEATRPTNIIIYNNRRTFWSVKDEKILSYTTNRIMGHGWRFYRQQRFSVLWLQDTSCFVRDAVRPVVFSCGGAGNRSCHSCNYFSYSHADGEKENSLNFSIKIPTVFYEEQSVVRLLFDRDTWKRGRQSRLGRGKIKKPLKIALQWLEYTDLTVIRQYALGMHGANSNISRELTIVLSCITIYSIYDVFWFVKSFKKYFIKTFVLKRLTFFTCDGSIKSKRILLRF